jgi:hypothetical protein
VDKDRNDRLQFLKRADVIWLMMDGTQLRDTTLRHWAVHRMHLLIERLRATIGSLPPIILVLTRRDDGEVPLEAFEPLIEEAREQNFELSVVQIASFANGSSVRPGFNIDSLMEASRSKPSATSSWWPVTDSRATEPRAMLRYRNVSNGR